MMNHVIGKSRMRRVTGFHGTSSLAADTILAEGFLSSRNPFDWLGDGVYFFQDGSDDAWRWARKNFGEDAVVMRAEVDLDGCMDLLEREWFELLAYAHDAVVEQHRSAGLRLPKQGGLAHGMDRLVVNFAVGVLEAEGMHIRSVRGVFAEGRPAFAGSALLDLAHIQIAVRDTDALGRLTVVRGGAT